MFGILFYSVQAHIKLIGVLKEYSREANEDLFRAYTWAREEEFAKVGLEHLGNPHAHEQVMSKPQAQVRTPK